MSFDTLDIVIWVLAVILGVAYFSVRSARKAREKKSKRPRR
jgi:hypothetical protein